MELLKKKNPEINALRDTTPELIESERELLGEPVYRRAKHVVTEQRRVFNLVKAFKKNDMTWVEELLLEGHNSLNYEYEVSLPILNEMVD